MSISVACACGKSFVVPDDQAGRSGRCRSCGSLLVIPAPFDPPSEVVSFPAAPSKPAGSGGFYRSALKFFAVVSIFFVLLAIFSPALAGDRLTNRDLAELSMMRQTAVICLVVSVAGLACSRPS